MGKFIICLLGGWFGLHKFVEKKTGLGVLYLFTFGLFGIGWFVDCIMYLLPLLQTPARSTPVRPIPASPTPVQAPIQAAETKEFNAAAVPNQSEPVTPEQRDSMAKMCADIHTEYKELLKKYNNADTDRRVYILKECYRKLEVISTTVGKYKCYYEIDTYDEMEKIERKARSFINAYIKEQREAGYGDYLIDVDQFSFDLDFISDYIYEKSEKLNRM